MSTPVSAKTATQKVGLTAENIAYSPTSLLLKKGKRVTISVRNNDNVKHNLTIVSLKVNKDVLPGKTGTTSVTPKTAGTFEFHCEYHPQQMKGTITVN